MLSILWGDIKDYSTDQLKQKLVEARRLNKKEMNLDMIYCGVVMIIGSTNHKKSEDVIKIENELKRRGEKVDDAD
jgi:hypothetical protein